MTIVTHKRTLFAVGVVLAFAVTPGDAGVPASQNDAVDTSLPAWSLSHEERMRLAPGDIPVVELRQALDFHQDGERQKALDALLLARYDADLVGDTAIIAATYRLEANIRIRETNYDDALILVGYAEAIDRHSGSREGLLRDLFIRARILEILTRPSDEQLIRDIYQEIKGVARETSVSVDKQLAKADVGLGNNRRDLTGDAQGAIEDYDKALAFFEADGDFAWTADIWYRIGECRLDLLDFEAAVEAAEKSIGFWNQMRVEKFGSRTRSELVGRSRLLALRAQLEQIRLSVRSPGEARRQELEKALAEVPLALNQPGQDWLRRYVELQIALLKGQDVSEEAQALEAAPPYKSDRDRELLFLLTSSLASSSGNGAVEAAARALKLLPEQLCQIPMMEARHRDAMKVCKTAHRGRSECPDVCSPQ